MAKFNIEVELDWLNEEMGLDEEIQKQVISGLQNRLVANLEQKFEQKISSIITEKAESIADEFIAKIMTDNIANIQMPIKTSSWGSEVNYLPLSEFVGKQFENAMTEKTLNERGGKAEYRDDKKYSIVEYLTKGYIAKELNSKVSDMIRDAKEKAEQSLIKNLEENLQQQLHADMVKRLNIPQLLQNLQNTIDCEVE
ncbi:hypothetical protein MHB65_22330 [Lysinibacillus sp. FSL K6-0075]|uniref:hypothetical protein n=1 Tax=Lysinibacillus sp. FSL K6-0075 TaxID=2921415 RepID=UPI003159526C